MKPSEASHLSGFDLDRLVFGQMTGADLARAQAHLQTCAACRDERDQRANDARQFDREVFSRTLPAVLRGAAERAPLPRGRWGKARLVAAVALAIAAALALFVRADRQRWFGSGADEAGSDEAGTAVATKGEFDFAIYARDPTPTAAVRPLDRHDRVVHPNDEIRFVLVGTPPNMRHAMVASIDAGGVANVYFPYGGRHSAEVPHAGRWEVPGSIVLDGTLGPERVFAILSIAALAADDVRAALTRFAQQGPDAIRDVDRLDLPGTIQRSFVLFKKPR